MTEGLRTLIVTPAYLPDVTGNSITAHRLYKGLSDKGVEVKVVVAADCKTPDFQPDIIHALHALKGGVPAKEMADRLGVPFVVTVTGTDFNIDLMQHCSSGVSAVLDKAAITIVYSELAKKRLLTKCPFLEGKVTVIRPSVDIGRPKGVTGSLPKGFNFLLPSGIRRVKNPLFAIRPLELLRREYPSIKLVIVGPVLDGSEWKRLSEAMEGRDWISYRKVAHDEMPDIYQSADVVLNTSVSEGLSNAVIEAMYFGKAVLASGCDGNTAVISDGIDGLLYKQCDEENFLQKAKSLIPDPDFREGLGKAAIDKVAREYSLAAEIEGHLRLYGEILGKPVSRIKRK